MAYHHGGGNVVRRNLPPVVFPLSIGAISMYPVAIIQIRLGSTRLPGKGLMPLVGHPMLWHLVQRVRSVPGLADVVVATSTNPSDQPIRDFCVLEGLPCFSGSEHDVLDRIYRAALHFHADPVVRILGDCHLVDPGLIARVLAMLRTGQYDLVGVATGAGALHIQEYRFPDGLDAEAMTRDALATTWGLATSVADREHVSIYMCREPETFRVGRIVADADYRHMRWTVDYAEDYLFVKDIYEALWQEAKHFTYQDVLAWLKAHPEAEARNRRYIGQERYAELWGRDNATDTP
mgnify:FL=1